jgi:hypothetical protein
MELSPRHTLHRRPRAVQGMSNVARQLSTAASMYRYLTAWCMFDHIETQEAEYIARKLAARIIAGYY